MRPHEIVPFGPVGDKREAENLISRMTSSGQTNIYHALAHAQRSLAESRAEIKHIILLSDGLTGPAARRCGGRQRRGLARPQDQVPDGGEPVAEIRPRADGGITTMPLWPALTAAGLLLFLLDILVRRAPWNWRLRRPAPVHS